MKSPLQYQATEFDCGPTSMVNAVRFLFRRDEIHPEAVKQIMLYSLDSFNAKGESGKNGTSTLAMMFLSGWLNQFGKVKRFPIRCEYLTGDCVTIGQNGRLTECLQQGGAVVVRVRLGCGHYVLLTGMEGGRVLLFDPYFRKRPFKDAGISITDEPLRHNRSVDLRILNCDAMGPAYALGPVEAREAVLVYNERTRRTAASTIEYFI